MNIYFTNRRLQKKCNGIKEAQKTWGTVSGQRLMKRLDEIRASENLEILKLVHPRCHPLTGDRDNEWSVDLEHPYRLVFVIADNPIPLLKDGGIDLKSVTSVMIMKVEDTHVGRAKK